MNKLPDAIFVIDTKKEHIAVTEANKLGMPVVAVVDTNCDPDVIQYIIPGNDDAIRSGNLLCRVIADAVDEGRIIAARKGRPQGGVIITAPELPADPAVEAARNEQQAQARRQAAMAQQEREARLQAAKAAADSAPVADDAVAEAPAESPAEAPAIVADVAVDAPADSPAEG